MRVFVVGPKLSADLPCTWCPRRATSGVSIYLGRYNEQFKPAKTVAG